MFAFVESTEDSVASANTTLLELAIILAVNGHWLLCHIWKQRRTQERW